jgi:two-component system chemotaxis sensor kinase CheA
MLLRDKNIFIVEDNLQNRIIFQMTLGRHAANIFFERWGKNAILQLKNLRNIDLIVLDLMLAGGVSGYDIFDEIRQIERYGNTPIVAVSATEPSLGIAKTREKGFSGFISKPIDDVLFPKQLAQIISGEEVWYAGERF